MHPEVVQLGPGSCPLCGMALEPRMQSLEHEGSSELADMTRRLRVCIVLTIPLLWIAMRDMLPGPDLARWFHGSTLGWCELALATPVVLFGGAPFFVRAWLSLAHRSLNMFTLIGLGVAVAYAYSLIALLAPRLFPVEVRTTNGSVALYFEPAAVIVTLVLIGQVLELKARSSTNAAIKALLKLAPKIALRVRDDGREEEVALDQVVVGDRLRVRPGERAPVDGVVLEGHSALDESMITGESMPVEKHPGANLIGGTINASGSLIMRAERVGSETLLAQIVRLVGEAQRTRAPIQRLADRISAWFVPAVMLASLATFTVWLALGPQPRLAYAIVNAVAVLIIACPCALGLATPMSIVVATGRAASMGILFKNAEAIELLHAIDTLVVDKTGTLTVGKPGLATIESVGSTERKVSADASSIPARSNRAQLSERSTSDSIEVPELLRLAASLERGSEHPLAAAIVRAAEQRALELLPVQEFEARSGKGVVGTVGTRRVALGNRALLAEIAADTSTASSATAHSEPVRSEALRVLESRAETLRAQGQTVVFIGIDGEPAGLIGVADPIKESTARALDELRAEGVRIVMLTGDHRATADVVARKLGIEHVIAGVLPPEKAAAVRRLQHEGRRVAMAGDGINDAPALAQAEVGIAMGGGTDIAIESAGVTLVRGDLRGIVRARSLSRATMRNIRQNLFFAFAYNALGVPLAAGALYPSFGFLLSPMIAAAAMSLSSVSVIANALRIR